MSLQIWLPLNDDLHNQGLNNDIIITNNGTTIQNDGKIGKCYCPATIAITNLKNLSFNESSYCFWAKTNSTNSWQLIIGIDNTNLSQIHGIYVADSSRYKLEYNPSLNASNVEINKWHHYSFIVKNGESKVYYDGILQATSTETVTDDIIGRLRLGVGTAISLNDMRIYDHALSDKEVEEIAKGLVLHYKLNNIEQDYSTNLVTSLTAGGQTTVTNNIITTSGTNADTYFTINLSENIVEGTSYIISCDAEIPEGKCWTFPLGWQGNTSLSFQIYNGHNIYTFTANSGSWGTQRIFMDDGGSPNSARSTGVQTKIFNFCVTKSGNISDSSGYNNNGILHDITAKLITDTVRYKQCIKNTQSATSTNYLLKGNINVPESSALTFSWWMNPTQWGNQSSGIFSTSSNSLPTDYSTTAANMRDSCFDCCNTSGTCVRINVASFITLNEWHHYVLVYNGSKLIFYKDGVQQTTANQTGNLKAFTSIWPFYSLAGGAHRNMSGSLSDFRVYVTALTVDQVAELYHTSASIDNKGNLYARELVEN